MYQFCSSFSHGEEVAYAELKEYVEPDFTLLNRNRCPVLAKKDDQIWHKARVTKTNFDEKTCLVTLEHTKNEIECQFADVFPISEGNCLILFVHSRAVASIRSRFSPFIGATDISSSDSSQSDDEDDDGDDYQAMHRASMIEKSLLSPAPDQALGEWEKYTKVDYNILLYAFQQSNSTFFFHHFVAGLRFANTSKTRLRAWNGTGPEW